jgi:hypothetical protein
MTSAPKSASTIVAKDPASPLLASKTRIPAHAPRMLHLLFARLVALTGHARWQPDDVPDDVTVR